MICNKCQYNFHLNCVKLKEVPDGDWYCSDCKNDDDIIKAGESLKESKKKAKMPSSKTDTKAGGTLIELSICLLMHMATYFSVCRP